MSTDSTFKPNSTHGKFWEGYMLENSFAFKLFTYFPPFGLLGLDKFLLRSPLTALLKFLVNLGFWGAWYWYDVIQLAFDEDREIAAEYGFSNPYGPSGHGFELVKDLKENDGLEPSKYYKGSSTPWLLMLYVFLSLCISFTGLPQIFFGDYQGGLVKLATSVLLAPVYMLYGFADIAQSSVLEKEGLLRPWPFVAGFFFLLDKFPATLLLPSDDVKDENGEIIEPSLKTVQVEAYKKEVADLVAGGKKTAPSAVAAGAKKLVTKSEKKKPEAAPAQQGGSAPNTNDPRAPNKTSNDPGAPNNTSNDPGATNSNSENSGGEPEGSAQQGAKTGFQKLVELGQAGLEMLPWYGANKALSSTANLVSGISGAVGKEAAKDPKAVLGILGSAPAVPAVPGAPGVPTTPAAAAAAGGGIQSGGGLSAFSEITDYVMIGGIVLLIVGGFAAAVYHKIVPSQKKEDGDDSKRKDSERDDAPPVPGGI